MFSRVLELWTFLLIATVAQISCINIEFTRVSHYDLMKCSYGERGSLTATCVNATSQFFKSTLYKFDHLDETVRCVNCTLTVIESNTFDLSGNQIKVLDLSNSQIETLKPKAFMGLIFMKVLNMSDNKIRGVFPGTFVGTKKIVTLDLSRNQISTLSESGFAELVDLEELILKQNQIEVIDLRAFNGLAKLRQLDLSYNSISAVNKSLENSTALEVIDLSHNAIHQFAHGTGDDFTGVEFANLLNLKELDLSNNHLHEEIEIKLKPGNQLRKLNLANNIIGNEWFRFTDLQALEELDLRFNNISAMQYILIDSLPNLQRFELAHNNLKEFNTLWFTGLPQLRTLNCSHNMIENVDATGIFSLQNLHSLDLSYNWISDLDYTALIFRLPSLTYLRLEGNVLPCDLEQDMETTFADDNFKFVLYNNKVGQAMCVTKPVKKSARKCLRDEPVYNKADTTSASDVVIFIFISVIFVALGVLFYFQYLAYKEGGGSGPKRVASTVQLISSDADGQKEDEFDNIDVP